MSKKCPWCKVDVYLTELKHWYKCPECQTEFPERAFPKEITTFDHITASPEALAAAVVYPDWAEYMGGDCWTSPFVGHYHTKDEAITATVEKLKETYNE